MGTAADTLVNKNPTRIAQLKGPILNYLKEVSKTLPFNGTDQDLYLAVFYPAYRRKASTTPFPADVQKYNPGIKTPADYVNLVNSRKQNAVLTDPEWTALKDTAKKLNIGWEPLFKLITFESLWEPLARNKKSGARGLIQFMPKTAEWLGYKASGGPLLLIALAAGGYFIFKKLNII